VAAVALLELVTVNRLHGSPRVEPFPVTGEIAALAAAPAGRVSSEGRLAGGANAATVHRLYDVTGDTPFSLAAVRRLQEEAPEIVWWQLLDVTAVSTTRSFPDGAPVALMEATEARDARPQAPVPESDQASDPEAAQAHLYAVLLGAQPVWTAPIGHDMAVMSDPAFDPRKLAPLSPEHAELAEAFLPRAGRADATSAITETRSTLRGLGRLAASADVATPSDSLAVLSSAFAPGWRAFVRPADARADQPLRGWRAAPVVAAYGALVATPVAAGRWSVRWTYLPGSLILGTLVTASAAGLGGVIWIRSRGMP
jgi:hypothetical protein